MNKWGVHWPNCDIDGAEVERIISLGCDNYVMLHYQASILPRLRARLPDAKIVMRFYDKGFLGKDPTEYARAVATEAEKWREYTTDWVFTNEPNLEMESGPGYNDSERVALWCFLVASELRILCSWMRIHAPPMSPVGDWWRYYMALMGYQNAFDAVDAHAYGELLSMQDTVRAICSQTSKEVFVSELNGPGSVLFFKWLEGQEQISGGAYFIWKWQNPDLGWNLDLRDSWMEDSIRRAPKKDFGGIMWDKHEVWDTVQKKLGGQGFNAADAFGQFAINNPTVQVGIYVGPILGYDRPDWAYLVQPTTMGALICAKASNVVTFASRESQLPN